MPKIEITVESEFVIKRGRGTQNKLVPVERGGQAGRER
jgi:hypothetical protein